MTKYSTLLLCSLAVLVLAAASALADSAGRPKQPNFVVILGEGHGWSSTSVRMDDAVPQSKNACGANAEF